MNTPISIPKKQTGMTLIELVIFMIIMSIAAVGILIGLNVALSSQPDEVHMRRAMEIANSRMAYAVGRADIYGLLQDCDGGSPPPICTVPSEYTVETNYNTSDAPVYIITVTVTGDGDATLVTRVVLL